MTEQDSKASAEYDTTYNGLRLHVANFEGDPASGIRLRGFTVEASGAGSDGDAKCIEGYHLGFDAAGGEVYDDDVLDVYSVNSYEGQGLGTSLTGFCLEEGKRRGFSRARMNIHHPKMVTIVDKLQQQGIVKSAVFFAGHQGTVVNQPPSAELLTDSRRIEPKEAIDFLSSFEAEENGYVNEAGVYSVLEI